MIDEYTVFVLGAGASVPYGFPTGDGLNEDIIKNYESFLRKWASSYSRLIGRDMLSFTSDIIDETAPFIKHFKKGHGPSIDRYITDNSQFLKEGKMAILFSISEREHHSRFGYDIKDSERRKQDWYKDLFNELIKDFRGSKTCKIDNNKISFITFNYDRSLENFLYSNLINHYTQIDKSILIRQLKNIPIIHVYGKINDLYWESKNGIGYHSDLSKINIQQLVDNLFVIQEERDNPNVELAKAELRKADRVIFLGFGFAEDNLNVLSIPDILKEDAKIYYTQLNLTDRKKNLIYQILKGPKRYIYRIDRPLDCVKLLEECFITYR